MSWASDAVERLRQPHNNGSAWAIERAIRETIEEAARRAKEGTCIDYCEHARCESATAIADGIRAMEDGEP